MGADVLLPAKVCFCCSFEIGVRLLMLAILVVRLAVMVIGCWYGPMLYVIFTLGALYIAADVVILYTLFWKSGEAKATCDFPNQKIWIIIWEVLNIFAIIGLIVAIVWFSVFGTWAMLYKVQLGWPVHFVLFIIIIVLAVLLIYTGFILVALYTYLKEAYIDNILGSQYTDDDVGLTSGGRRISV